MSKPRIYIVIGSFHPIIGGTERQALTLGRSLRERGYEATIITFRQQQTWQKQDSIEGVPVIRVAGALLQSRERFPRWLQQLCYALALLVMGWKLWQERSHYDILHVYQLTRLTVPAACVCLLTRKPLLVAIRNAGLHATTVLPNTPSLMAGPLDPATPWLKVHERVLFGGDLSDLERLGKPLFWLIHLLLRRVDAVAILLSSRMYSYLLEHHFALQKTCFIPNGVDLTRFQPINDQADASEERARTVICVSRLCYQKGIDVLLQAWYLIKPWIPNARLVIVGDGPAREQLMQMIKVLDLVDVVEFTGEVRETATVFRRGSIAVLPSRLEGMPNAVLEAMACGLPCIATRVSGSEDIIQHGVNGQLVEPEDYQGLARALLGLLHDPKRVSEYGQAARASIESQYTLERVIDMHITLYHSILHSKKTTNTYGKLH